jgi:hypothetical protein
MRFRKGDRKGDLSWRIAVDRWNQEYDWALWLRAAERIDAPAGGAVPGPLDLDPLPAPTADADPAELRTGWLAWWRALTTRPSWQPVDGWPDLPPRDWPGFVAGPPDFAGLADWPELQRVAAARWTEADAWHDPRKLAGIQAMHQDPAAQLRNNRTVGEVEKRLRRRVPPFSLEFILLPVRDEEIRQPRPERYLVPERVYDSPRWTDWLGLLVTRLAT